MAEAEAGVVVVVAILISYFSLLIIISNNICDVFKYLLNLGFRDSCYALI